MCVVVLKKPENVQAIVDRKSVRKLWSVLIKPFDKSLNVHLDYLFILLICTAARGGVAVGPMLFSFNYHYCI